MFDVGNRSQGCTVRCASNHLIVSVYKVPQMQGVGRAGVLLYFKCLADAVPCEHLPMLRPIQCQLLQGC